MVNESRPSSTIEVENVNGSQSVSVVVLEIPNATILTTHESLDNVQTKLMVNRQKLDRRQQGGVELCAISSVEE